jgi:hypothetical protein
MVADTAHDGRGSNSLLNCPSRVGADLTSALIVSLLTVALDGVTEFTS